MIIAFTGAQSTGKSTLLQALQNDPSFKDWNFVPEITRSLKEKYNITINEGGAFETQVLTVHSHIDNYLLYKDKNAVFDRCAIDAIVYTAYVDVEQKNVLPIEFVKYCEYITQWLTPKYDFIFYTEPEIPLVEDGVRSPNQEYRDKIIKLFELYIDHAKPTNLYRLKGSVEERVATIKNILKV